MKIVLFLILAAATCIADVVVDKNGNPVANGKAATENNNTITLTSCDGKRKTNFDKKDGYSVVQGDTCERHITDQYPDENKEPEQRDQDSSKPH